MPADIHTKSTGLWNKTICPIRPEHDTVWHNKEQGTEKATNSERSAEWLTKNNEGTMGSMERMHKQ